MSKIKLKNGICSEIVKKYLKDRTMESLAYELNKTPGLNYDRRAIWHWKEGNNNPSADKLFKIMYNPRASELARSFAKECLAVLDPETWGEPYPESVS